MPRTDFARRLIKVREAYGAATQRPDMDQKEFARILGFGEGQEETYRRYERGETEPPLRVLAEIHRVTGASLDELIAGTGAPFRAGRQIISVSANVFRKRQPANP